METWQCNKIKKQSITVFDYGNALGLPDLYPLRSRWNLLYVNDLGDIEKVMAESSGVGIITLGKRLLTTEYQLLHGFGTGSFRWIALLDQESLTDELVNRIVVEICYDFHTYPIDVNRLSTMIGHALGMATIKKMLNARFNDLMDPHCKMVGSSPQMKECFRIIRKISVIDAPVLIMGESGTGKELVARAIHDRSSDADAPFVTLNCGALPSTLIQSELFGYERGAFTGANQRKIGHIEAADTGTIFLDEIGDMPLELQINLLRFLQLGVIQRIGSSVEIPVKVRVIAATHVDLERACKEGRFREDLFYRLNVLSISLPPLRMREGDVELLARYFFDRFSKEYCTNIKGFASRTMQVICSYSWPGNVREMINRIKNAIMIAEGPFLSPSDLKLERERDFPKNGQKTLGEAKNKVEREFVRSEIRKNLGNLSQTAKALGISRVTLYHLIKKHSLEEKDM